MAIITDAADGGLDIAALQRLIQNKEAFFGVLLGMSVTESDNQLSFHGADGAADIPAAGKETFLETVTGHPAVKPGATLVCFGTAFVESRLQLVAAYRPA